MDNGISKITIKNIKGIDNKEFKHEIIPNKPHILVAPNGFGKSSFAIAFNSLNSSRILLDEKNTYKNNPANKPLIELEYKEAGIIRNLIATDQENSNTISTEFDYFVINSQLIAHSTKQNHGKFTVVNTAMKIAPITLVKTIPQKYQFTYSISNFRKAFGNNANKFINNISTLLDDMEIVMYLESKIDWHELSLKRTKKTIDILCEKSKTLTETQDSAIKLLTINDLPSILANPACKTAIEKIQPITNTSEIEAFFILWQFIHLKETDQHYNDVIKYYDYCLLKIEYTTTIKDFNSSWNTIQPEKEGKSLVVKFPNADFLSNGQRDLLSFVLLLKKAEQQLKKEKCILIIDEIFDYLDDANLVSFQYYISKMIQSFKKQERKLFPLLMTHLDPLLFSHFRLSGLKIHYLDDRTFTDDLHFLKLIQERDNNTIKHFIDHYLFHFTPTDAEEESNFAALNIRKIFASTRTFRPLLLEETQKYLTNQPSDPYALCFAIRFRIEENIYNKLANTQLKNDYIDTKETMHKLDFAAKNGVTVPEIYYLLSIIYNSTLHARKDNAEIIAKQLLRNLTNITIKKMIRSLFPEFR